MTFGIPGEVTDAVFLGAGGVWVVNERTVSADAGLSFVASDFSQFQWYQGGKARGLPFTQARRVVGRGSSLWLATDVGVVRITPKEDQIDRFDAAQGIPDSRILDIAQRKGRLVAATAHGLAEFSDSAGFIRLAPDFVDAAQAVELSGDTTWVGTRIGLFAAIPGQNDLLQPDALGAGLSFQTSIVDLTWRGDTLIALTTDRLIWRDPGSGKFTLGPLLGNAVGRLHTVVNGKEGLYIAGDRGVGFAQLNRAINRALTAPGDLPDRVTDLAVDDRYLWVTTLKGLVRFQLDVVGR
jgi:ligand-binding sensor domain-containing protein